MNCTMQLIMHVDELCNAMNSQCNEIHNEINYAM